VDGTGLWTQARSCQPVVIQRMDSLTTLLQSIMASAGRHATAVDQLTALAQTRETFLASVSHELRTPLSIMSMRTDMLLHGTLDNPEAIREPLVKIKEYVTAQSRLIEDLIDVAKTRTGQFTLHQELIELQEVVRATIGALLPNARAKHITIDWSEGQGGATQVFADPFRLQQVFWNLISNAIKFTPDAGVIEVSVLRETGNCIVKIRDSGGGISPEMQSSIFNAFTRQSADNPHGLGLGLSISQHIVAAHGGEIWVESSGNGKGSTFFVRLPTVHANGSAEPRARATT
jgi:signal transduction histidine kinase